MQGGSNVFAINSTGNFQDAEVVNTVHFTDGSEKHLSYGIDILDFEDHCADGSRTHRLKMASCSFYDRKLSLWTAAFEKSF